MRDAADAGAGGQFDGAPIERQFTPDQPEQRGFARTIAPDDAHLVARGNGGAGTLEQGATRDGIGDV